MAVKVSKDQSTARGHTCMINRFDEETVMVPFNENELNTLRSAMERRMYALRSTKDYPEEQADVDLLHNINLAAWMLTRK